MTKTINRLLLLLALLFGVPFYLLLIDHSPGDAAPRPLHVATLRQLASSMPGPAPSAIEVQAIATRWVIGDLVSAGSGLKLVRIACFAWRLPVAGRGPLVIDGSAMGNCIDQLGMDEVSDESISQIKNADVKASVSVQTHDQAYDAAAAKLSLQATPDAPAEVPMPYEVADPEAPRAIAPGVVVVPALSQSPGYQMFFVRLANGRELLFTGGIAPLNGSWFELRGRSRYFNHYHGNLPRREVYSWLMTIRQLSREAPQMTIVPGHDWDWVATKVDEHRFASHFTADTGH